MARLRRSYQTQLAEISCSLGAWGGAGKQYNFGYMTSNKSMFDSRGWFFRVNLSDKDIAAVRTTHKRLSNWAMAHTVVCYFSFYSAPQCSHCKRCT